jgi:hypothetical protein
MKKAACLAKDSATKDATTAMSPMKAYNRPCAKDVKNREKLAVKRMTPASIRDDDNRLRLVRKIESRKKSARAFVIKPFRAGKLLARNLVTILETRMLAAALKYTAMPSPMLRIKLKLDFALVVASFSSKRLYIKISDARQTDVYLQILGRTLRKSKPNTEAHLIPQSHDRPPRSILHFRAGMARLHC